MTSSRPQSQTRAGRRLLATLCLLLLAPLAAHAGLSVQINEPAANMKVLLGEGSIPLNGTVSYPEKEEKEEEATIVWTFNVEGRQQTRNTKSGESGSMELSGFTFPSSNSSFGEQKVVATVNKRQVKTKDGYSGESMEETIIEQDGTSNEGWIVNNGDPEEQDMVIGDDTSDKPGCTYIIRGFCTESNKGSPSSGVVTGQPWTSDDPNHWAYWVRQAVIAGNRKGLDDGQMIDLIWHITNRRGPRMALHDEIGYPVGGPTRNYDDAPPLPPIDFNAKAGNGRVLLKWRHATESDLVRTIILYRTDGRYPANINDGQFLIALDGAPGAPESYVHQPVTNGQAIHYAAFSADEQAIASAPAKATVTPAASADAIPPSAPLGIHAVPGKGQVQIHWTNPGDTDLKKVRLVMREDGRYPRTPTDGKGLFEQTATRNAPRSFTATGLVNGRPYHFACFATDEAGNISEPALVRAIPPADMGTVQVTIIPSWGKWALVDSVDRVHRGTGNARIQVPAGEVTMYWTWGDDYEQPLKMSETAQLPVGGLVNFTSIQSFSSSDAYPGDVLNYLLGFSSSPADLDYNNDRKVDVADFIEAMNDSRPAIPAKPYPEDQATDAMPWVFFNWYSEYSEYEPDPNTECYDLYLWKDGEPRPIVPTESMLQRPGKFLQLPGNTKYYWQVVARNSFQQVPGPVWSFTTLNFSFQSKRFRGPTLPVGPLFSFRPYLVAHQPSGAV